MQSEDARNQGLSRRDLIKYTAAAAAAAGAAKLVSGAHPESLTLVEPANAAVRQVTPGPVSFMVDIPGCASASANIHSVQVDDLTVDVLETDCGVAWDYRTYAPGDAHYGKATFRSRVGSDSKELLQWIEDAGAGKQVRKNIAVIVKDPSGAQLRRWNLMECFPVKYDPGDYSPSSCTQVETIVVKVGHVEFA